MVAIRGRGDWEKLPAQEHQAGPSQLRIHAVGSRGWLPVGGWVCAVGLCSRGDVVGDARSVEMAWDEDYVVGEDRRQRGRGGTVKWVWKGGLGPVDKRRPASAGVSVGGVALSAQVPGGWVGVGGCCKCARRPGVSSGGAGQRHLGLAFLP